MRVICRMQDVCALAAILRLVPLTCERRVESKCRQSESGWPTDSCQRYRSRPAASMAGKAHKLKVFHCVRCQL